MAFHSDYCATEKIEILKRILHERGIQRVYEVRWTIAFEIELESFQPCFEGSIAEFPLYGASEEAFVFASHENSITLTGKWLVEAFRNAVPHCDDSTYLGQLSTPDLRGRW